MKKIMTFICMIALLLGMSTQAFAAGNPSLSIDAVTAESGESVDVPVKISGNTGICGAQIIIEYDDNLELTDVKAGDAWTSMTFTKPGDLSANPVTLVWDGMEADTSVGTIAVLTFKAPKEAGTYEVKASYEDGCIVDGDINPVQLDIANGSVEVKEATQSETVDKVFGDVYANYWYTDAIQYVYDNGIMSGSDGKFNPENEMTRAMMVVTLYRVEGSPKVTDYTASEKFSDVLDGWYYVDAVNWAYNTGVTTGYPEQGIFGVDDNVTREQVATFMYRYAKMKGYDVSATADISGYIGADEVNWYAQDAMKWAVGAKMISGIETWEDGQAKYDLAPQGNATRAQLATILKRFCEYYNL